MPAWRPPTQLISLPPVPIAILLRSACNTCNPQPATEPTEAHSDMLRQALRSGLRAGRALQSGWVASEAVSTRTAAAASSLLRGFASQVSPGGGPTAAGGRPVCCKY